MPAVTDHLELPDPHLDPVVAAAYDDPGHELWSASVIDASVSVLAALAATGTAVEFAVGTGRLALPLAQSGVAVRGIDQSAPMLAELRKKAGSERVLARVGDMTTTQVCNDATLVYLVFNTIMNLRSQAKQVACFRNAAAHLAAGGAFLIENMVPQIHRLSPGETVLPFNVSESHLGFEEYVDRVDQISISHHYFIDGDKVRISSPAFRYVWPSELDLMAQLAGLTLESLWADWDRSPFTGQSQSHVSVWRRP